MSATDSTDAATGVVNDLVRTLDDGSRGFGQAADRLGRVGHPDIAARFADFAEERAMLSQELRTVAEDNGIQLGEDPAADGASEDTWIDLTDALTDDDPEAVLRAAESSEDRTVAEFDRVLSYGDCPPELEPTVRRQVAEIRSARNEVAALLE